MSRGWLITFSGIDGAGKSTQIALLRRHLAQSGCDGIYLWSRGGYTPLFEGFKRLMRRLPVRTLPPPGQSTQRTQAFAKGWIRQLWLVLALLDLAWLYGVQVRWWQRRGRVVICDRYLWDTLIDFQLNFPDQRIKHWVLWRVLAHLTPQPTVAFLLLVPVEESIRRSDIKREPFRDSPGTLVQRLAHYKTLVQEKDKYWHYLDGRRPAPDLAAEISAILNQRNARVDSKGLCNRGK